MLRSACEAQKYDRYCLTPTRFAALRLAAAGHALSSVSLAPPLGRKRGLSKGLPKGEALMQQAWAAEPPGIPSRLSPSSPKGSLGGSLRHNMSKTDTFFPCIPRQEHL